MRVALRAARETGDEVGEAYSGPEAGRGPGWQRGRAGSAAVGEAKPGPACGSGHTTGPGES